MLAFILLAYPCGLFLGTIVENKYVKWMITILAALALLGTILKPWLLLAGPGLISDLSALGYYSGLITRVIYKQGKEGSKKLWVFRTLACVFAAWPLILATPFLYLDYKKKIERTAELEGYWARDIQFSLDNVQISLPVHPRVKINHSYRKPKGGGSSGGSTFSELRHLKYFYQALDQDDIEVTINELKIKGVKKRCEGKRASNCAGAMPSQTVQWCDLRPDMHTSYWCSDAVDGRDITFRVYSSVGFEARKNWLNNQELQFSRKFYYKGATINKIKELNLDANDGVILTVCFSDRNGRLQRCRMEFSITNGILVHGELDITTHPFLVEELAFEKQRIENIWKNLTNP